MNIVLDASAIAGWLMPDETPPGAIVEAVTGAGRLAAPWLLRVELQNILIVGERRGRLGAATVEAFLAAVEDLGIELDTEPPGVAVLHLARAHRLSAYDALYLELARRRGFALATLDGALTRAAVTEGVRVIG